MANDLLGKEVYGKTDYPDDYVGCAGKVVCIVKQGRRKEYIVQYSDGWCWYSYRELRRVK